MPHGIERAEVLFENKKIITQNMAATIANRKTWIDWAKAIGILLVVMGHSNYAQDDINPMIFMIHMPLFFVVSGYLFKTDKGLKAITQSNIRTLLIPYILFNAIWMVYILPKIRR
jgi:fucose 4-O-acetylase-like acetyltransferase